MSKRGPLKQEEVDNDNKEWDQNNSIKDNGYDNNVLIELGVFTGTATDYKEGLYDAFHSSQGNI